MRLRLDAVQVSASHPAHAPQGLGPSMRARVARVLAWPVRHSRSGGWGRTTTKPRSSSARRNRVVAAAPGASAGRAVRERHAMRNVGQSCTSGNAQAGGTARQGEEGVPQRRLSRTVRTLGASSPEALDFTTTRCLPSGADLRHAAR